MIKHVLFTESSAIRQFLLTLFSSSILIITPAHAEAVNQTQQAVIAEIAENHLTPPARKAAEDLLAFEGLSQLRDVADWARRWSSDHPQDATWFVERNPLAAKGAFFGTETCPQDLCPSHLLALYSRRLADRRLEPGARLEALKFVVALTTAAWQPIRCIDNDDDNGRKVAIALRMSDGRLLKTTLFDLWDERLFETRRDRSELERLEHELEQKRSTPPPSRPAERQGGAKVKTSIAYARQLQTCLTNRPGDLSGESSPYAIGRTVAYRGIAAPGHPSPATQVELGPDYESAAWNALSRQLVGAGLDLATSLNLILTDSEH